MANAIPNSNGSQFLILANDAPHLDRKHSVFGRIIRGFATLSAIEAIPTTAGDRPLGPLPVVSACGVGVAPDGAFRVVGGADDALPDDPEDLPPPASHDATHLLAAARSIREEANGIFRSAQADGASVAPAAQLYQKALRYAVRGDHVIRSNVATQHALPQDDADTHLDALVRDLAVEQRLLLTNLAAAATLAADYHGAVAYADRALRFDPRADKALYRKAVALRALGDLSGAKGALLLADRIKNPDAAALCTKIENELREGREAERQAAEMAMYSL